MSPKAVFERLRLASELRDLCIELGRSKKAEASSARPEHSSKNNAAGTIATPHEAEAAR